MKKLTFFFIIFILYDCFSQTHEHKNLIVAEYCNDTSGVGNYTYLVSYSFQNGVETSKDTILGASTSSSNKDMPSVGYSFGGNQIYKNRYVITSHGNVIDLISKNLFKVEGDEYVEAFGDTVVFCRNYGRTEKRYKFLNLLTKKYDFVQDESFRPVTCIQSPNYKYNVEIDKTVLPRRMILLDSFKNRSTLIQDCGEGTLMSGYASEFGEVPFFWIDDTMLIYTYYSTSYTPKSNIEIRKVNVNSKFQETIVMIDSVPLAGQNAFFMRDIKGDLIFNCSKGSYKLDLANNSIKPYLYIEKGYEFQVESNMDSLGSEIRYRNGKIGKLWCNGYGAVTTDGYLAVEYGDIGTNLGYPKGIKVWSNTKSSWTTIDIPWVCALIGWID